MGTCGAPFTRDAPLFGADVAADVRCVAKQDRRDALLLQPAERGRVGDVDAAAAAAESAAAAAAACAAAATESRAAWRWQTPSVSARVPPPRPPRPPATAARWVGRRCHRGERRIGVARRRRR